MTALADSSVVSDRLRRLEEFRWHALRVAVRYSHDRQDALDAVQEAFIKIALSEHIDWSRIKGLVSTATRNVCIDQLRSTSRRYARDEYFLRSLDLQVSPEDEVCDRAEAAWLASKMSLVGEREQRMLFRLADGAQITEIAREEGMTYKAVHCAVTRARKVLVTILLSSMSILVGVLAVAARRRSSLLVSLASVGAGVSLALGVAPAPFEQPAPSDITTDDSVDTPDLVESSPAPSAQGDGVLPAARAGRAAQETLVQRSPSTRVDPPHAPSGHRGSEKPIRDQLRACVANGVTLGAHGLTCSRISNNS